MNYFRVLFVSDKGQQMNADVLANDLKHAVEKTKARYYMPSGFAIFEGFKGNCKKGEKLFASC